MQGDQLRGCCNHREREFLRVWSKTVAGMVDMEEGTRGKYLSSQRLNSEKD